MVAILKDAVLRLRGYVLALPKDAVPRLRDDVVALMTDCSGMMGVVAWMKDTELHDSTAERCCTDTARLCG
jgi:hypothetical protein